MAKIAYFDCFSGVSGDMTLGALVDAGAELGAIEAELRKLPVKGWSVAAEKVKRGALAATFVRVTTQETHHHRGLTKILDTIAAAGLASRVAERAAAIFRRLGEAEARIHNTTVEQVHFHEVGALDAIVDIVGAAVGFELLGIEEFACSAVNVGGGRAETAHGPLPVPAPASVEMLRGKPVYSSGIEKELTTPTGAAIVSTLCTRFGALPAMTASAIGYGAGSWELKEQANVLRLVIGESAAVSARPGEQVVTVLETNLDDMNPQIYGYLAEQAFAAGALDVYSTAVQMKKGRPGVLLTLLCEPAAADRLVDLLFRETTTLGVRSYEARRRVLARETVTVETSLGSVRMKLARMNGSVLNAAPEYEDCRRIAAERGVPLKQVLAEAALAFERQKRD
jgi:uncharacterized protein (TIGR00299 family) protein